jgi:2'-5' RNA ligase
VDLLAQAGPETSELAMIAVYPRPEEAAALAVEDGLEADDLHITLVFLGDVEDVDESAVTEALALIASELAALEGTVGGLGRFSEGPDGVPVIALPDVQGLTLLRERAVDELGHRGIRSPSEHGFLPHMTLTYEDPAVDSDPVGELSEDTLGRELHFDAVSAVFGGRRMDYALEGARTASAASGSTLAPMPYHIERGHEACSEAEPYAVLKDSDGEVMGCHETREEAESQLAALYAAEDDADEEAIAADATVIVVGGDAEETTASDDAPRGFAADLVPEGIPTDDGRFWALGAISWREPPLTLLVLDENTEGGHLGAVACGHIDQITKHGLSASAAMVVGAGAMDSGELGRDTARRVEEGTLAGISVDLAIRAFGVRDPETGEIIPSEEMEEDEWTGLILGNLQFAGLDVVVGAATIVPFPAHAEARIAMLASGELHRVEDALLASARVPGLVEVEGDLHLFVERPFSLAAPRVFTACSAGPLKAPASWFEKPRLTEPTVLTVTAEGRIFGHVSSKACHNGYQDRCLQAAPIGDGLHFHTAYHETDAGDLVRVGRITVKPHAPRGASMANVQAHYDDARRVAAFVRAYDDEFGIVVAGVTRSDAPPELLRDFLGNPPSIDQRRGVTLGVSSVPVPGLPILQPEALIRASADGEAEVEMLLLPPVTSETLAIAASADPREDALVEAEEIAAEAGVRALAATFK